MSTIKKLRNLAHHDVENLHWTALGTYTMLSHICSFHMKIAKEKANIYNYYRNMFVWYAFRYSLPNSLKSGGAHLSAYQTDVFKLDDNPTGISKHMVPSGNEPLPSLWYNVSAALLWHNELISSDLKEILVLWVLSFYLSISITGQIKLCTNLSYFNRKCMKTSAN